MSSDIKKEAMIALLVKGLVKVAEVSWEWVRWTSKPDDQLVNPGWAGEIWYGLSFVPSERFLAELGMGGVRITPAKAWTFFKPKNDNGGFPIKQHPKGNVKIYVKKYEKEKWTGIFQCENHKGELQDVEVHTRDYNLLHVAFSKNGVRVCECLFSTDPNWTEPNV